MHWINERNSLLVVVNAAKSLFAGCGLALLSAGCLTPSPFHDSFADEAPVTTPSSDGIHAAGALAQLPKPRGERKFVPTPDGTVLHRPLYFEDPAEECGSDDGKFAWTGEDFLYIVEGPLWFMGNAITFPVDAVIYPPWDVMASDGVPDCRWPWLCHDSSRWHGCVHQDEYPAVAAHENEEPID